MPTNRNTGSNLSKSELLNILNNIDAEHRQDKKNIPDQQNEKNNKSKQKVVIS
jgi:hypothetical protein